MIIEIPKIQPGGSRYAGADPAEVLDLEGESLVRGGDALHYELVAEIVSGGVLVRGRVWSAFELVCGRCAEIFSTTAADSDFIRDYPLQVGQQELDITADLREAVLLQLPAHPVCSEQCRGLCPRCGRNLNRSPCRCADDPPAGSDAWKALDGLKL